jgi:transcription elongation factor GreB
VDAAAGKISWRSPLGAALLKAHPGDVVTYRTPRGPLEIEVLEVSYTEIK